MADTQLLLGAARQKLGRLQQAEVDMAQALAIHMAEFGALSTNTTRAVAALSALLVRAQRFDRAEMLWLQATVTARGAAGRHTGAAVWVRTGRRGMGGCCRTILCAFDG